MRFSFCVRFPNLTATLTVSIILSLAVTSAAQNIPSEYLFMTHRWDAAHGVVFFGKGLLRKDTRPIRGYEDGVPRGAPINIFKDFPHLGKAVVDDFAAGSDGITHIAAGLIF